MNLNEATLLGKEDLLKTFNTQLQGLSEQEALIRQRQYGLNEIQKAPLSWPKILFRQVNSPFMYLLYCAAFISFLLGNIVEGLMILFFITFNTILGFYQEYSAEKVVQFLKKHLAPTATAKRDGKFTLIESKYLVPGDVISIQAGDLVPADIRLIESQQLSIDESILTGESIPVQKNNVPLKQKPTLDTSFNSCFSGTLVVNGNGIGIVVATGENTELGTIDLATTQVIKKSNFTKEMQQFSTFIVKVILIILLLLLMINIFIKWPNISIIDLFTFSVALAVTITPEMLPLVITFSLARGARKLAQNKVIVKRLSSIEDLGNIEILCSDKTGTLTENKLKVSQIYAQNKEQTILYAYAGSSTMNNKGVPQNPFDNALWQVLSDQAKQEAFQASKLYEIPFDSFRMRTTTIINLQDQTLVIVKGAFETIKNFCNPQSVATPTEQWIKEQGINGNRVLAVAYKKIPSFTDINHIKENDLTFAGAISFEDPIKSDAFKAISKAKKLGIKIKILTGDAPEVSFTVGKNIELVTRDDELITGAQFEQLSLEQKKEAVIRCTIFARVTPLQKCTIIQLLQEHFVVGYLGDGINDAPALKTAAVGIAVKGSSDVANQAADIILLQKSLSIIINGIFEGRTVFENTLKYIKITLASNFGNFLAIGIASLFIDFLPMIPRQILLVNMLTDLPMLAIASDTVSLNDLRKLNRPTIKSISILCGLFGCVSLIFDFLIFILFYKIPSLLQTNWFIESVLSELVLIFSLRTRFPFYQAIRPSYLLISFSLLTLFITLGVVYNHTSRTFFEFIYPEKMPLLIAIVIAYFITNELVKYCYYKRKNHIKKQKNAHH